MACQSLWMMMHSCSWFKLSTWQMLIWIMPAECSASTQHMAQRSIDSVWWLQLFLMITAKVRCQCPISILPNVTQIIIRVDPVNLCYFISSGACIALDLLMETDVEVHAPELRLECTWWCGENISILLNPEHVNLPAGVTVAWVITSHETASVLHLFLSALKERSPDTTVKVVMTDDGKQACRMAADVLTTDKREAVIILQASW